MQVPPIARIACNGGPNPGVCACVRKPCTLNPHVGACAYACACACMCACAYVCACACTCACACACACACTCALCPDRAGRRGQRVYLHMWTTLVYLNLRINLFACTGNHGVSCKLFIPLNVKCCNPLPIDAFVALQEQRGTLQCI